MDAYYFQQIKLPFRRKTALIAALMRFIVAQPGAVPRNDAFFGRFISDARDLPSSEDETASDRWLVEHVARLFWICCTLGLLQYQYPYPHKGQTYLATRAGRLVARAPKLVVTAFIVVAYAAAIGAAPVKQFTRVRNIVAVLTGALLWWRQHELSALIVAASVAAGIVSTWIVSFFSGAGD
jgi:hypothetical protein